MRPIHWYIVGLIVLAAFGLRVWQITSIPPGLYPDEATNGNNAIEALELGHWKVFYPENNGREGLFMNIQAVFIKAIGQNEPWVLRLPSAIFGSLTVLGLFLLIYELGGASNLPHRFLLSVFASFFLATSVWHIIFSRIGFRAITAPFFLTFAIYFTLLAFRRRWFRAAILAGISFGLGFYSYIAFRPMPALLLVLTPYFFRRKDFWHIASAIVLIAVIVFLPLGYYFATHPADFLGRTAQVSIFSSPTPAHDFLKNVAQTFLMFNFSGDWNPRHNIPGHSELFWPVGLLLLWGIVVAVRRRSLFDWTFLSWFLLALLPVVISNEGIPHALRSLLLIPPAMAFAGSGAVSVYQFLDTHMRTSWLQFGTIIFLGILIWQAWFGYFVEYAKNPNIDSAFAASYVEIARQINALPNTVDKFVVVNAGGVMAAGIPVPAQTVMFMTNSWLIQDRVSRHIEYLLPDAYLARKDSLSGKHVFFIN